MSIETQLGLPAAAPSPDVLAQAREPGLRLPAALEALMRGYADRPALGGRKTVVERDAESGANEVHLLPEFATITYGELWSTVKSVAAQWGSGAQAIEPGSVVVTIGFASTDYVVVDLVCAYLGLVAVPLAHTSSEARLRPVIDEVQPRVIAASADLLDLAAACAVGTPSVRRVVVFDYEPGVDEQREAFQRNDTALAAASISLEPLSDAIDGGRAMPEQPSHAGGDEDRLALILYTSGSTGTPKGVTYTERMVAALWTQSGDGAEIPRINVNFMPMNHVAARMQLGATFSAGGVNAFVSRSDLSTLFDDWTLVRPTQLPLIPRVVDMLFQRYRSRLDRLVADGATDADADREARTELREGLLGGRVLSAFVSTAPLSADMEEFVNSTLQLRVINGYGSTEIGPVMRDGVILRPPVLDYKLVDVPQLGYFTTDRPHPRGELLVKSTAATPGYYQRPELTVEMFDDDGYYRTGDVMVETAPEHLTYLDRRNNVMKLAQGEFVAVTSLEATFGDAPLVRQIYVYGNSERSSLLAVIVPADDAPSRWTDPETLKSELRDSLRDTARRAELQPYEIPADFLVEESEFTVANGLLSGVGKLARPQLKERYGERLERLYETLEESRSHELRALRERSASRPVSTTVADVVQVFLDLPSTPSLDSHFADLGGDSLSALTLSDVLGETFDTEVPVGVIIAASTDLAALATYIERQRNSGDRRPTAASVHGAEAVTLDAADLTLNHFIDDETLRAAPRSAAPAAVTETVLLTGANGYLGKFLALEWLRRLAPSGGKLIALVRGTDAESASRRLEQAFDSGDAELRDEFRELSDGHLEVVVGDVIETRFGLDEPTWRRLASDVDVIVHPAGLVNHILPYAQLFGPNVTGTAEVIRLAISERIKPVTYLSTVLVAADQPNFDEDGDIREVCARRTVDDGYANGYGNSKWAGEVLLREANDLCQLPVSVLRCDMILAHRRFTGQLNVTDAFTRLIIGIIQTGLAPVTFYVGDGSGRRPRAHYDGLPADFVAEVVTTVGANNLDAFHSYDVLNPHEDGVSLDVFVDWLIDGGLAITRIHDHSEWVTRFEGALRGQSEQQRQRSALAVLDSYRNPLQPVDGATAPTAEFARIVESAGIGSSQGIPHLDAALIGKYVSDLKRLGLV